MSASRGICKAERGNAYRKNVATPLRYSSNNAEPIASKAINDVDLYDSVIKHRQTFIGIKGFDYSLLRPQVICIIPPVEVMDSWKKDYETMQETMIYGDSLPFDKMIEKIAEFNKTLNNLP